MFAPAALFLALIASVSAVDVTGTLEWNHICANSSSLGPAKAVLDAGKFSGNVIRDGSFSIPDVPVGTYILSVLSHDYLFDQARIDVLESTFEARPYTIGTPLDPASPVLFTKLSLPARQRHIYFVPIDSFNLLGMVQNPMTMMVLFVGAMVLAMPYLMKNMDPETMKEFSEQRGKMSQMQDAVASGNLTAGFSALLAADDLPPVKAQPASSAAGVKNRGKNKRR
ncbi:hypothetical protein B0H10DRAFT_1996116 [Mycena sp. CBHHK59/15]|nr:hypothetical protein B0H10DRAFT_1996116 [Mycena sp. CBHHK59/15]